eukprot:scaffold30428_cov125-Isochrysis_galbana.AAC.4
MAARHVRRRPLPVLLIGMLAGRARALHLPAHRWVTRRLLAPSGRVLCSRAAAPQSAAIDATPSRRSAPGLRAPASDSLRLLNTLTGKPDLFEPIDPACVKWYTCGPTVYDAAHLGHARNYVGFDIVRRVLTDYFGYMLLYVMNITDIDDKIILRTHRNHLQVRGDWRARAQEGPLAHRMNLPLPLCPQAMAEEILRSASAPDHAASASALRSAAASAAQTLSAPKPALRELVSAQDTLRAAAAGAGLTGTMDVCDVQREFLRLTAQEEASFFGAGNRRWTFPPQPMGS